jgi:hypothetical protein
MANSFRYSKARSNGRRGRFADRLNPSRFRYLTDIVALTIAILGIEILFGTLYTRQLLMHNSSYDLGSRLLAILVACFLVRLRGQTLAEIA